MRNALRFYSFSVYLLVLSLASGELLADVSTLQDTTAHNASVQSNDVEPITLRQKLGTRLYNQYPDSIHAIAIPGLYEIVYGDQVLYTDAEARFIIRGEIIDLQGAGNLTAQTQQRLARKQAAENAKKLTQLAQKDSIFFKANEEKTIVTVLTEIGCPFCSRLHDERASYLKQGVSLRYVFYSPEGDESGGYQQAKYVWCQVDRSLAFTQAMQGKRFPATECEHPLAKHKQLTQQLKLAGTPAIIFAEGTIWHGYYPATKVIAEALKKPS